MKAAVDQNMKKKVISVTDPGLLNRTAWTNAAVALDHIKKVGTRVQCLCVSSVGVHGGAASTAAQAAH